MARMLFQLTLRQLRGLRLFTVGLAAVTVGLAAISLFQHGMKTTILTYTSAFALSFLLALWTCVTSPWAFTECSPDGIRVRGLFGLGIRNCPWEQVASIEVVQERATDMIMVTRHDGSRFRLGVPRDTPVMRDRDFHAKFARISRYWQEAAPHGVSGLPSAAKDDL
ncbi:MAG: hypothetical protein J2P27_00050 [Actinobacteria bacterium]|nr:hypothetical protein [Actinomycetota bacterium]